MSGNVALRRAYRLIFFTFVLAFSSGWKKNTRPDLNLTSFQASKNLPIVLHTSDGVIDQKTGQITIPKRVTLWQGEAKITADSMCYTPQSHTIRANGHVEMLHANGTLIHCDSVALNWNTNSGTMRKVRLFSSLKERLTAQSVQHKDSRTELTMGSYTPCSLCKDQLNPFWSIHAREMVLDKKKKRTEYTDAHLSIFGRPVFYIPYFYIPTARSSGFVSPDIGMNAQLGGYIGIPYFLALSPEHDITITPYFTLYQQAIFATQYRGHTHRHQTIVEGAINPYWYKNFTYPTRSGQSFDIDTTKENLAYARHFTTQGFVHGKTLYSINEEWRFSGEQWWVSDKTFLNACPFLGNSESAFLPSHATLERFDQNHYWNIRTLNYQGLQSYDQQKNMPYILPEIRYAYTSPALGRGQSISLNGSVVSLYRQQGDRMQRFHCDGQWDWSHRTHSGQNVDIFMRASSTLYALAHQESMDLEDSEIYPRIEGLSARTDHIHDARTDHIHDGMGINMGTPNPLICTSRDAFGKKEFSAYDSKNLDLNLNPTYSTCHHIFPQWGVRWSWPWMLDQWGVLEPIAQVLIGPNSSAALPPNEDSQSLIFDESNFWNSSRFSGYDRCDQSTRINYGLDWSHDFFAGRIHIFLGQSYALSDPAPVLKVVGIRTGVSDCVGQIDAQSDYGDLIYRFRWDGSNGKPKFQEIGWQGGPSWAFVSASYAFTKSNDPEQITSSLTHYNQIVLKILSKISTHWTLKTFTTYDFDSTYDHCKSFEPWYKQEHLMDVGMGLGYQNECFSAEFSIQRSYYAIEKTQYTMSGVLPGLSIGLSLRFQSLGGLKQSETRFDHGIYLGW